jgi:hypothetical protein
MDNHSFFAAVAAVLLAASAHAETCEGGAYLNPQFFRGEAAHQSAIAEQEMRGFIAKLGLPAQPLYSIKKVDDITASGRAPYCWIYSNLVVGVMSGYKPVAVNTEAVQPAVLAITNVVAGGAPDAPAVHLKNLPAAEQKAVLDQLQRSRCMGTASGVEAAIVKAEGLCAYVEDVAPQATVGQQGLIAKAAFAWEEGAWAGIATREASALAATTRNLAGRSEKLHHARLVVVPTKSTSMGFGLYVHASVPEATVKKAVAAFKELASPSKPLAIALDLGPQFSFVTPSAEQVEKMAASVGVRR